MNTNVIGVRPGRNFHTIATGSNAHVHAVLNDAKIFMCLLKATLNFLRGHADISGRSFSYNNIAINS